MTTIFVNGSTGNDTTGTGTRALPYATASKAHTVAADGDYLVLATGTNYDFAGAISKSIKIRGSGGTAIVVGGTTAVTPIVVAGAVVSCYDIRAQGATDVGASGFRVQEGGELDLVSCISSGNNRPFTIADTGVLNATDTAFTGNAAVSSYSATAAGEFLRCTGMPGLTVDTKGVTDRLGTIHRHTFLRASSFYAAPEFYAPGTRTVYVESVAGNDASEGTSTAPMKSTFAATRMLGAKSIVLRQSASTPTVYREGNSNPASLNLTNDLRVTGSNDAAFNPIELRFSKAFTDWTLDTGTTYKRTYAFEPAELWRNDQFADTLIKRLDGTTFPASNLPDLIRPWVTLVRVATVALVNATSGTWTYVAGVIYSNIGSNPSGLIECPAEQSPGVVIDGCTVNLKNLVIRGAQQSGVFVTNGGHLTGQNLYLLNNGINGLDMSHGGTAEIAVGRSAGNVMDGLGAHQDSRLEHSDWLCDLNGDDGWSPHDNSYIKATRSISNLNADRGAVAIQRGILEFENCRLDDNAKGGSNFTPVANGQNLSLEDQAQAYVDSLTLGALGAGGSSQTSARALGNARITGVGLYDATGALATVTTVGPNTSVAIDLTDRDNVRRETINAAS